jgi:hypothetical protein
VWDVHNRLVSLFGKVERAEVWGCTAQN